jgi:hypothetical protein
VWCGWPRRRRWPRAVTATGTQAIEGPAAAVAISRAISAFPEAISYVRAEVLPTGAFASPGALPADGQWLVCSQLCGDPDWLAQLVRASGRRLGTTDDMVAASLFVQNLAYRVMMVAVACAAIRAVVPGSRAADMAVTMSNGRPHVVGYLTPRALVVGPPGSVDDIDAGSEVAAKLDGRAMVDIAGWLIADVVDEHLALLIDATRSCLRIGRRLLWGNVASSSATAFMTMDGCVGSWVRSLGEEFFRAVPQSLRGHGAFFSSERPSLDGTGVAIGPGGGQVAASMTACPVRRAAPTVAGRGHCSARRHPVALSARTLSRVSSSGTARAAGTTMTGPWSRRGRCSRWAQEQVAHHLHMESF